MALRKPSEFFKTDKDISPIDNNIQTLVQSSELNTFSDAYDSFKDNLNKITILSEFSETFDNYKLNVERVNSISEEVENIKFEIQNFLKKEDLDRGLISQLIVVEQSIRDIQNRVKSINEENLSEIRLDVSQLSDNVNNFIEVEVPNYKKLLVDSEIRSRNTIEQFKEDINDTIENIEKIVDVRYDEIEKNLEGINEEKLSKVVQDLGELTEKIDTTVEVDIPKYKNLIVKTEKKVNNSLNKFKKSLDEKLESVDLSLEQLDQKIIEEKKSSELYFLDYFNAYKEEVDNKNLVFENFINNELPKYKNLIVENEIFIDKKVQEIEDGFDLKINNIFEKLENFNQHIETIEDTNSKKYNLIVEQLKDKLRQFKEVYNNVRTDRQFQSDLSKKVSNLEIEIIRNESHLKLQNKNLEKIQEEVKDAIQQLNLKQVIKENNKLTKKIKYLEELIEKFNDREIINESLITEPPSTKNDDPLTPLDKKYVTLDQLQEHYRLFINRIQQQLSTLGGGGETRLKYLDDVVGIATNPSVYDGKFLRYQHSTQNFVFEDVTSSSGTFKLVEMDDVDSSNLSGISTDYLMVYDPIIQGFKFVDPKTYFGINNDFNPSVDIDDFGTYDS